MPDEKPTTVSFLLRWQVSIMLATRQCSMRHRSNMVGFPSRRHWRALHDLNTGPEGCKPRALNTPDSLYMSCKIQSCKTFPLPKFHIQNISVSLKMVVIKLLCTSYKPSTSNLNNKHQWHFLVNAIILYILNATNLNHSLMNAWSLLAPSSSNILPLLLSPVLAPNDHENNLSFSFFSAPLQLALPLGPRCQIEMLCPALFVYVCV